MGANESLDEVTDLARRWWRSTSKRDFFVIPLLALLDQPARRRRLRLIGLVPMIAGYLLYRLGGEYRIKVGGGGPGLSGPPPERLVSTGIYAYTRNPMYSGHVLSLFGTAILTSSPLALAFAAGNLRWFNERVKGDEQNLLEIFGEPYAKYLEEVPRWGFDPARLKALLAGGD